MSQPKLSVLSRKITPKFRWDDLVLPVDIKSSQGEIINWIKNRSIVMDKWGFEKKLPYGKGISVLFATNVTVLLALRGPDQKCEVSPVSGRRLIIKIKS